MPVSSSPFGEVVKHMAVHLFYDDRPKQLVLKKIQRKIRNVFCHQYMIYYFQFLYTVTNSQYSFWLVLNEVNATQFS
ncbi:hypothetical protein T4D_14147 [Trichinella pseudospiralis]|uniref:Uncharacterized protein n=1 Tax=Trichinella pseudospiralis TaxID=6337 RepID=A0A0V1G6I5_TRIPS|nr:hypothetical protein T4D_14147 [Trichinella pseudospiralis]